MAYDSFRILRIERDKSGRCSLLKQVYSKCPYGGTITCATSSKNSCCGGFRGEVTFMGKPFVVCDPGMEAK